MFDFPFSFGQKSSLLLIFFFHGIVFSFLSLRKGIIHSNKASKWLSLLLFLYAMYITPYMLGYANWYSEKITADILFFIPFMQVLLIGPVVYFYTKSQLNSGFKLSKKDYIHFVPAVLYAIYSLIVFVTDKLILDDYYFYADGRDKDMSNWYQATGLVSMAFYLGLSLHYYSNYKKLLFDKVSYADSILFKWIRNFMIAFLGILMLRVLFFITNPEWGEFGSQFWHYIAFSFVFYYIAVTGYSNIIKQTTLSVEKFKVVNVFEDEVSVFKDETSTNGSEKDLTIWKDKLSKLMTENHLFENPRLTLSDVAKELNTNTKTISSVVNSGFNMNFNDFVNHYRIEAVKDKLDKGEQNTTTLLGIALDCGFNSKATFNRAFKKSTMLSPKDYLEK
ncbi:helix-turn-helix domain-containing protein [Winogradskyella jejuensis]|uniref:Transcriptional regulator, AraC family n=1 Tax=Winogradskyella jejuensis TaxID=1089305 RepID=A0A1M5M936_9FLAO|nr:helix-turn-helix domain-containing protein [Winogradskyella jejuensis]SHG73746.1 transcriptional regulator, AraC family [Winogradskyella jejuensis]